MAGYTISAQDINNRAGTVTRNLWEALEEARRMKLWLDDAANTDAVLTNAPINMPIADLNIIRPSMADLGGTTGLWAVARGTHDPSGANNFFFNAKKLGGTYWTG